MIFRKKSRKTIGEEFYGLLSAQSKVVVEGVEALEMFCKTGEHKYAEDVINLEKIADEKRRVLLALTSDTFITPIEREDIYDISRTVDDILDYSKTTIEEIEVYSITPTEPVVEMVSILKQQAIYLHEAITNLGVNKQKVIAAAVKAKKCENEMEKKYRINIARLFENDDIKTILKYRELYRHLSNAADKGDIAADTLTHCTFKNA